MKWLYFILLIGSIAFPLAWSFEKRVSYYKNWKSLFPALVLSAIFFLIWDEIFIRQGIWGFNEGYITGIKLFNLPIEEILFFIVIPYCCIFIYECVGFFLPGKLSNTKIRNFSFALSALIIVIGVLNFDKAYTFWNLVFAGTFIMYIAYKNPKWLSKFWIAYLYHLIPFLVINGVLTGTFLEEPVVWYNNEENLSIRIFTVPIEDSMYSLLLLLMNINFYEFFKSRFSK
jgi:lycopene cyclase domain-containing protein